MLAAQNSNGLLFFEMLFLSFRAMCVLPLPSTNVPEGFRLVCYGIATV